MRCRAMRCRKRFGGLVNRFAKAEAEAAVKPDSWLILRGDLQVNAMRPAASETVQGFQDKGAAEPFAAMLPKNAHILDGAHAVAIADALDGAAVLSFKGQEPSRLGLEAGVARDVAHQ